MGLELLGNLGTEVGDGGIGKETLLGAGRFVPLKYVVPVCDAVTENMSLHFDGVSSHLMMVETLVMVYF